MRHSEAVRKGGYLLSASSKKAVLLRRLAKLAAAGKKARRMGTMKGSVIATAMNAVTNCSRTSVSEDEVLRILRTGDGPGNLVRALFGDCSLETLDRLATENGMSKDEMLAACGRAKRMHAAANAEIDGEG